MNRWQISVSTGAVALLTSAVQADKLTIAQRTHLRQHIAVERIQADTDGDQVFDQLAAELARTPEHQAVPVIVRYKRSWKVKGVRLPRRIVRHLTTDQSVATQLTPTEIRELIASGQVASVEADAVYHATRQTAVTSFGVAKVSADFGLNGDGDGDPNRYTRQDLTIAILDTGIDRTHPDFAGGKIIASRDFVNGLADSYDDDGHGTHCASIAASRVVNGVGGVAPAASLINVKVLDDTGFGTLSTIASAVEWCIQNRAVYGIDVLSMSLSSNTSSDGTDALSRAVNRAAEAGLVVCVAAGNAGPRSFTIGSPSAAAGAITVGNMIDTGKSGFALNSSSSRGPTADGRIKPDLCAPGTQILAAEANTGGYKRLTGTSMACPFVAGVAALMLQANPGLSPADVKAIMKRTAVHFGPQGENNEFGAGRLDAYAAIAAASGNIGTPPAVPDHLYGQSFLQGNGDSFQWTLPIDDITVPIALTLIHWNTGTDFDLYLYDPQGSLVAKSEGQTRQETLLVRPNRAGTYTVVAYSYSGAGWYLLDFSAGSSLK